MTKIVLDGISEYEIVDYKIGDTEYIEPVSVAFNRLEKLVNKSKPLDSTILDDGIVLNLEDYNVSIYDSIGKKFTKVIQLYLNEINHLGRRITLSNNQVLAVTSNTLININKKVKKIGELRIGDTINKTRKTLKGKPIPQESLKPEAYYFIGSINMGLVSVKKDSIKFIIDNSAKEEVFNFLNYVDEVIDIKEGKYLKNILKISAKINLRKKKISGIARLLRSQYRLKKITSYNRYVPTTILTDTISNKIFYLRGLVNGGFGNFDGCNNYDTTAIKDRLLVNTLIVLLDSLSLDYYIETYRNYNTREDYFIVSFPNPHTLEENLKYNQTKVTEVTVKEIDPLPFKMSYGYKFITESGRYDVSGLSGIVGK